jgi:iron(II)-dependent oxidoreductase
LLEGNQIYHHDGMKEIKMFEEMSIIPAGEFKMGSEYGNIDEKPVHTVYLAEFYMDIYPVTNAQYRQFIEATGTSDPRYWNNENFNQSNQPVVGVTWYDAMAYAEWSGKRLPTEAEWEKAVRGGLVGKKYPWGNEKPDDKRANFNENVGKTTPVGNYPANSYGGNVWEWCADWYDGNYYSRSPDRNPKGPDTGDYRVLRGGSWYDDVDNLRVAARVRYGLTLTDDDVGFRCVSEKEVTNEV